MLIQQRQDLPSDFVVHVSPPQEGAFRRILGLLGWLALTEIKARGFRIQSAACV
jgi:hypothetical protein